MSDRERAYRILGLESDATLDDIEEIYQDLKEVWHPDRFADRPELREKAAEKQKAVEHAYQTLRGLHAQGKPLEEDIHSPILRKEGTSGRGPSILDDTLSERMGKSKRRFPIWIALFGLVAVAVVISFLTWSPVDVEPDSEVSQEEQIVAEIRAARSDSERQSVKETAFEEVSESGESDMQEVVPSQPSSPPPKTLAGRGEAKTVPRAVEPAGTVEPPPQPRKVEPTPERQSPAPKADVLDASLEKDAAAEEFVEEEPTISELAERSFQILRAKSDLANRLIEGSITGFRYKDWKAVERGSTEVFVDLVAEVLSAGREAHFVWAVDVEAQSVKPVSQAARDLQTGER